jgi:hypothetical protein
MQKSPNLHKGPKFGSPQTFVVGYTMYSSLPRTNKTMGASHSLALPFTLTRILKQKKTSYGNSNISPMQKKKNLHKKNPRKENQNIVQDII